MRTKRKAKEESLQISISKYLRLQYPNAIFTAEGSGLKLTKGQAVKASKQRSSRGLPDLWIDEPRGMYHGLRIELKREGDSPFRKDGKGLKKKIVRKPDGTTFDHIAEQAEIIARLQSKGYYACFSVGFDQTKKIIDEYMKLKPSPQ